jgi:hypothetical protein
LKEKKRSPMHLLRWRIRIFLPIGDLFADRAVEWHGEKNRRRKATTGRPVNLVPAGLVVEEPTRKRKTEMKILLLSGCAKLRRSMTWEQKGASISCASWKQLEPETASASGLFFRPIDMMATIRRHLLRRSFCEIHYP